MKNKKKILFGIGAAVVVILLCFGLKTTELLKKQQQGLSAGLYEERPINENIVIVAVDEKSISTPENAGLNGFGSWSRAYYAKVLETIQASKPSAVFFDFPFSTESSGIKFEELISIVNESNDANTFATNILPYAESPHPNDMYFAEVLSKYKNTYILKSAAGEKGYDAEKDAFVFESEVKPIEPIQSASQLGFYNVATSGDSENLSAIFAIPARIEVDGTVEEHVDLKLARELLNNPEDLSVKTQAGEMLINYAGKPNSYERISFSDVYYGQVDESFFQGKLVLIGVTASILQDWHYTPIDAITPMPGIEIHANAIQTILDEAYLVHQSDGGFVLLIAVITLAMLSLTLFAPILVSSGALVLGIAAFPFYAQWRFNHGTVIDLIWPVFALLASYLAALAYRNFTEFAEKRKLKTAFSRYVSPELAEQITEKPELLELGGEKRNITALFLDIENFTNLSEGLQPQEVVKVINIYFDALSHVIMSFGGSVDKYEGDAIMALFGAPVPSTDHAVRACRAALAIQARMKDLNAQMGYQLNIRVGLATGDAIVGNMGSSQRFDYTAMGDTVNTASRLEGANKFYKTGILVNPGTYEAAQGQIAFRNVDRVCLKGKDNAIEIYQVMGSEEQITPDGKAVLADWHNALADYRAANWDEAEKKIRGVLTALPEDGPAKTLLTRVAELRMIYGKAGTTGTDRETGLRPVWDGVWRFESK